MISFREMLSLGWWISFLHRTRYLHFFAVGMSGVGLNLATTVFFTEFVFGRENYFTAYLIGLSVNLIYNFTLHTIVTFKTTDRHFFRFASFLAYSLAMTYLQARLVKYLTDLVGVDWYVLVIASVIMVFSILTFMLFKLVLFKDKNDGPQSGT